MNGWERGGPRLPGPGFWIFAFLGAGSSVKKALMVRRLCLAGVILVSGWLLGTAFAEEFKLADGTVLSGELLAASASDAGVQIKVGDGKYERVPWANFSQEDLKNFAKIKKLEPLVEPFIEISQEEKIKKTEVPIQQPARLERPVPHSLLGALSSSGPGLLMLLLLYAANIYAAYEIAIFRARPVPLVCGVAAVLPFIGPIIFLCLPTAVVPVEQTWDAAPAAAAQAPTAEAVNPMQAEGATHSGALRLARPGSTETVEPGQFQGEEEKPARPATLTFQRGQYTFNRRFIETKFPGFFGVVRRDADRDMVLVIKSARGEYTGQRISRIAANDLHLMVQRGPASEEVMIPFVEIKEIVLKHKDA